MQKKDALYWHEYLKQLNDFSPIRYSIRDFELSNEDLYLSILSDDFIRLLNDILCYKGDLLTLRFISFCIPGENNITSINNQYEKYMHRLYEGLKLNRLLLLYFLSKVYTDDTVTFLYLKEADQFIKRIMSDNLRTYSIRMIVHVYFYLKRFNLSEDNFKALSIKDLSMEQIDILHNVYITRCNFFNFVEKMINKKYKRVAFHREEQYVPLSLPSLMSSNELNNINT